MKKITTVILRFLARIDKQAMFDDSRKIGIALIVTGTIGTIVANDKVDISDGLNIATIGLIIWVGALAYGRI